MRSTSNLTLYVLLAIFTVFWGTAGSAFIVNGPSGDFLAFYTAATMVREGNTTQLYSYEAQAARAAKISTQGDYTPFARPGFYALVLAPLAFLPFRSAWIAWLVCNAIALIGCIVWAARKFGPDAAIFGAMFLPTALGVAIGQDCALMLLAVIVAFEVHERELPFMAGVALACGLFKFHLLMLFPLAMLVAREHRMLQGFCAMAAGFGGLSIALTGTANYMDILTRKDIAYLRDYRPELYLNVYSIPQNLGLRVWISILLAGIVIILVLMACRTAPFWRWFTVTITGSLLVAPHAFRYDAGMLLLALWLCIAMSKDKTTRVTARTLATPVPFFLAAIGRPGLIVVPALMLALLWGLSRQAVLDAGQGPARA